jgi:phospholipid-binding lipoprotein MlaA
MAVRAKLLAVDDVVFGDKYIFYRDAYLQRREFLEKDGQVDDLFGDEF